MKTPDDIALELGQQCDETNRLLTEYWRMKGDLNKANKNMARLESAISYLRGGMFAESGIMSVDKIIDWAKTYGWKDPDAA